MNLLRLFSIGADRILRQGHCVSTTVSAVERCWWLRVNTKPVRRYSGDGAVYPNIIVFDYKVNGIAYQGRLYIPLRYHCPEKGEQITVYYDPADPRQYACHAFGLGMPNMPL